MDMCSFVFLTAPLRWKIILKNVPLFEMKMAKPEPEIFKAIIEDAGIEPKETLFIDDSEMNCKTAQNLGISTYTAKVGEDWSHLFNLK